MAPDIHVNYRLRGIPHDCQSRSEVRELVGRVLPVESGTNLMIYSLAINPTERTSRVATLTFNNIPHPLSDKTKDQWVFYLPRSDSSDDGDAYPRRRQLVFDTHFSGFTPLQHTEEEDCRVDLIALSGLGGHAFGSFKERNGSFMWLRDALTIDIPVARVMIYGYDTSLVRSTSFQNLANLGRALQADLKITRKSNRSRPIIFVGHSLGGLVLKEAIIKMKKGSTDEDCEVLQSTSAFLFFGVPHEGMAIESLVPLVGDQPNRALLESLGKNSEVLHRLQDDFNRAFGAVSPKVVSYFETEKSPTAQKELDIWKLTGPPEVLVDPASAVCGSKDQHPINRNHSEMVKYTSHYDEIYTRVRATLERLVSSTRIMFDDSTGYGASLFLSDQQQECLRSLSFAEQDQRCKEICVGRETCEWLRDNAKYRSWASRPRGLLWIKGNPGVGKSFLMKSAYTTMRRWIAGELVVSFFFHGRGVPLQRTPIGLFRALLSSTLAFFPEFLSQLVVLFQEREKMFGSYGQDRWTWSSRELEDFLTKLLTQETKTRPVVIFVDALDECGRDAARCLLSYFKDLMAGVIQEGGKLRVCFSSRHYPVLGLDVIPTVIVEEQNAKDIRCVIRKQLKEIQPEEERRQLEKEILMKAQGGFQWAVMVASMAIDDHEIGINAESLRDRIRTIPQALEQLYTEILNSIPASEKHQTLKLFEWVLFAGRPLVAQELREALVTNKDMTCVTVSDLRRHCDWTNTVKGFERRVKHLSRGLMEFQTREVWEQYEPNGEDFNREAQFIHQSVPDFLQEGGMSRVGVYSIATPLLAGPCHFQLAISCIKYLMLSEVLAETTASLSSMSAKFPLAPYAARFFFFHIRDADTRGISYSGLLSLIQWNPQSQAVENLAKIWRTLDPHYTHTPDGWPFFEGTALHVLVALGSMSAFKSFLQEDDLEVDGRDSEGNSPLLLSVREGRYEMALVLIHKFTKWKYLEGSQQGGTSTQSDTQRKTGHIDVNTQNKDGDTALTISLMDKANSLTFALVDAGADLECYGGESSLVFYAISVQNKELLIYAVVRNIRLDGAIYFAIRELEKYEAVLHEYVSLLLKAGAKMSKKTGFKNNMCLLGDAYRSNIFDPLDVDEEAIHQAARYGRTSIIELLLSHGASASIPNSLGKCPLELAVQQGHEEAAEMLFRQAPTTITHMLLKEVANKRMDSLVILFIDKGMFTSVQPMLWYFFSCSYGAASEVPRPGNSDAVIQKIISMLDDGCAVHEEHDLVPYPVILAITYGRDDVAKALIRRNPTCVNDVDTEGKTALVCALQNGKEDFALFLLTEGKADTNFNPLHRHPLILAAMQGYTAVVKAVIISNPTCVNSKDSDGGTALVRALENENEALSLFLVTEGKASNTGYDFQRRNPLMLATMKGYTAVVKAIVYGDPTCVNFKDTEGRTALIYALEKEDEDLALFLATEGQVSHTGFDHEGRPPLMLARMKGYSTVFEALLQRGRPYYIADDESISVMYTILVLRYGTREIVSKWYPDMENLEDWHMLLRDEEGKTLLMRAASLGSPYLVRMSLESEIMATILDQDNNGKTALMYAALSGDSEVVRLLLDRPEADSLTRMVDKDGKDVFCHAFRAKNLHVVNTLESMGHMDLVHSIDLSEAVAFRCKAAVLRLSLENGAVVDFPTRYSWLTRGRFSQLENTRGQVAAHICGIAPFVVATLHDGEQVVEPFLATGKISKLSYLEALRIARIYGLKTILARLESYPCAGNLRDNTLREQNDGNFAQ